MLQLKLKTKSHAFHDIPRCGEILSPHFGWGDKMIPNSPV